MWKLKTFWISEAQSIFDPDAQGIDVLELHEMTGWSYIAYTHT